MGTVIEVGRLRKVYRHYAKGGFAQSKWCTANRGTQAIRGERGLRTCHLLEEASFMPSLAVLRSHYLGLFIKS